MHAHMHAFEQAGGKADEQGRKPTDRAGGRACGRPCPCGLGLRLVSLHLLLCLASCLPLLLWACEHAAGWAGQAQVARPGALGLAGTKARRCTRANRLAGGQAGWSVSRRVGGRAGQEEPERCGQPMPSAVQQAGAGGQRAGGQRAGGQRAGAMPPSACSPPAPCAFVRPRPRLDASPSLPSPCVQPLPPASAWPPPPEKKTWINDACA